MTPTTNTIEQIRECASDHKQEYHSGQEVESSPGAGFGEGQQTGNSEGASMDQGTVRFMRSVAPICIAAFLAVVFGLLVTLFIGGVITFIVSALVAFGGFVLGLRRGEQIVEIIRCIMNR